jgi:hypothetical protein
MLVRLLLALLLVVGFTPARAEQLAAWNGNAVTLAAHHHAADDLPCPSPCGGETDHGCPALGACCAASLPTVAAIAISPPPSIATAWGSPNERFLTGRLHRPTIPPPRT